eukprot:1408531-Rhodomonas_salina.1
MSVTPAAAEEDDSDSGGWAAWKWALVGVAIGIVVLLLLYFLWTRMKSKKPANVQQYAAEPVKTRSIAENFPEPSRFLEPELPDPSRFKLQHFTPEPKLRHITPAPDYELASSLVFEVSTYFQAVPSETRMPPGVVLMGSVPPMVGSVPPIVGSVPQVVGSLPVMIPGSTPPMMPARLVAMPPTTPPRVGGTVPPTQFPVAVWSPMQPLLLPSHCSEPGPDYCRSTGSRRLHRWAGSLVRIASPGSLQLVMLNTVLCRDDDARNPELFERNGQPTIGPQYTTQRYIDQGSMVTGGGRL